MTWKLRNAASPSSNEAQAARPKLQDFRARVSLGSLGQPSQLRYRRYTKEAAMNAKIESAVLIRRTNITHLIDGDQRSVILPIVRHNTNSIVLEMPSQQAVVPPGDYMLFVNARDKEGNLVPSASKAITVTGELSAMCQ